MTPRRGGVQPDITCFVQVAANPSIGVELSTGRAWIGVDQQVGHGSADALFALTDQAYAAALDDGGTLWQFQGECWRGEHNDLRLFHPSGGAWLPERWFPCRKHPIPARFAGELWWHLAALGQPEDGEQGELSRSLAAGTALITTGPDGLSGMTFRLVGDDAYPRPAALIAGLTAGSDREHARTILGDTAGATSDEFAVEGVLLRLGYADAGLVEIVLERPDSSPPDGSTGAATAAHRAPEV
ncbi:hypothetical protein Cme02nite_50000 [Catellatospora methionotrophica]|uniref:Uncharacterized protein n=1 Tax=Catellatospora methionotrophica TaxID=121620 RepID=A0A8J3PHQ9_9ACTN|nr:hypothetical protein [Catellatospora methionotrophica]GIG16668.1 hypothetical protein Cme02nite_50000 [Catellatospora methionotrophica]